MNKKVNEQRRDDYNEKTRIQEMRKKNSKKRRKLFNRKRNFILYKNSSENQ